MGFYLDLFVIVVVIMLILLMVTQLVYPMFTGEPLFPLFRRSAVKKEIEKVEHALEEVAEATHLKQVVDELNRRSANLKE
jgi:hypothetical protein